MHHYGRSYEKSNYYLVMYVHMFQRDSLTKFHIEDIYHTLWKY